MRDNDPRTVWASLKRGWRRNFVIFAIAMLIYHTVDAWPEFFGPVWAPMVRNMGMVLALVNAVDILLRIWQPYADNKNLVNLAETDPRAAAEVFKARVFFVAVVLFTFAMAAKAEPVKAYELRVLGTNPDIVAAYHRDTFRGAENAPLEQRYVEGIQTQYRDPSIQITPQVEQRALSLYLQAQITREARNLDADNFELIQLMSKAKPSTITEMPVGAKKNSPILIKEMRAYWPAMKQLSYNAAQIEQETCTRLTSEVCWTSNAQLNVKSKNGVEKGRGFGQLTAVWRANGTKRFDNVGEMRIRYPKELGNYGWDNWNDPELSMRAYVLFMRDTCKSVPASVTDPAERFKMCLSGYNGGMGGLSNDILSCRASPGCLPTMWDGNVELTSAKSKTRVPGYGQPAFDINRGYVSGITVVRRVRYLPLDKLVV